MSRQVTFKGSPVDVGGDLPQPGDALPAFTLTTTQLADIGLDQYDGKRKLLNIFPSLDTGTCFASVRRFNSDLAGQDKLALLQISADLPMAHARFRSVEEVLSGDNLSTFRSPSFALDYGVRLDSGPLVGLCARAVVVADSDSRVTYSQMVPEIGDEPDYEAALAALNQAS